MMSDYSNQSKSEKFRSLSKSEDKREDSVPEYMSVYDEDNAHDVSRLNVTNNKLSVCHSINSQNSNYLLPTIGHKYPSL
jgi:hypothetical protein